MRSSEHVVAMKMCYRFMIFGPGKLRKRSLEVLEKSWNFFGLMVYEPCMSYFVRSFENLNISDMIFSGVRSVMKHNTTQTKCEEQLFSLRVWTSWLESPTDPKLKKQGKLMKSCSVLSRLLLETRYVE